MTITRTRYVQKHQDSGNFAPPATDEEIRASALQFVRKIWSGATHPPNANEAAFNSAVEDVTSIARRLIDSLTIKAPPRNREEEARKARERARSGLADVDGRRRRDLVLRMPWLGFEPRRLAALPPQRQRVYQFHHQGGRRKIETV